MCDGEPPRICLSDRRQKGAKSCGEGRSRGILSEGSLYGTNRFRSPTSFITAGWANSHVF